MKILRTVASGTRLIQNGSLVGKFGSVLGVLQMGRFFSAVLTVALSANFASAQNGTFEGPLMREGRELDLMQLSQRPSATTQNALTVLQNRIDSERLTSGTNRRDIAITPGAAQAAELSMNNGGQSIAVDDQVIIRFTPDATDADIMGVIEEYNLEVIDT